MTAFLTLKNEHCTIKIAQKGAELTSFINRNGEELIWPGLAAWPRHAPNLFPIVGKLKNNRLRHGGQNYSLSQHGFARDLDFVWEQGDTNSCRLSLTDSAATRLQYPFAFRFEIAYALQGSKLSVTFTVTNTGDDILPASFGAHPGFQWPLYQDTEKSDYALEFDADEDAPLLRFEDGLLSLTPYSNGIRNRILNLNENLFIDDVMVFKDIRSRSVIFRTAERKAFAISWDDGFPHLGIWSKPGNSFLCIEPWQGLPDTADFDGEISVKPEMLLIPPGEMRTAAYTIRAFE